MASFEDIRVEWLEIFLAIVLVILGISAAFGNLVSLYIFGSMGNRRNGSYTTRLVFLNLAITDLINGFVCIPFTVYLIAKGRKLSMGKDGISTTHISCTFVGILFNVVSRTSILLVTAMSVDRFVGLFYPAFYKRNIRKTVVLIRLYVLGSWTTSVLLSVLPLLFGQTYIYIKRQLRCSYAINRLHQELTAAEKLPVFVVVQMLPTYVPVVVMVTTSLAVYVQIRRNIDSRRKQISRVARAMSTDITGPASSSTPAKQAASLPTVTAGRVSIVFNEHDQTPGPVNGDKDGQIYREPTNLISPFNLEIHDSSDKSSEEDDIFHSDSEPSLPPSGRRHSQRRFTFEFDPHTRSADVISSTPQSLSIGPVRALRSRSESMVMRVQEDLLTSPMYHRRKGFTAPSSRRVSEQNPTNSSGNVSFSTTPRPMRLSIVKPLSQSISNSLSKAKSSTSKSIKGLIREASSRLQEKKECEALERRKRGAMTVLLMVVLFLLCYMVWLVLFAWIFAGMVDKSLKYTQHMNDQQKLYLLTLFPIGAFVNSGVNPYIYYKRNTVFKRELERLKFRLNVWWDSVINRIGLKSFICRE